MIYRIGDRVRLYATFKDMSGALANPTTTTVRVLRPDDNGEWAELSPAPSLVHDAIGKFHADVTVDRSGIWQYRFAGTGAVQKAEEKIFSVQKSAFPNP